MSRVGELVLVWLLTRAEGKGSRSALSSALKSFASHRWSPGEWSTRLDESLATLESGGLLQQTARKGVSLTKEGRARALEFLGVKQLPKGLSWKKLRLTHLTALALGLPSANAGRLDKADNLRAVLVEKQLGLEEVGTRKLKDVRDELCWKQLGVETDKPFTLANVQSFLLGKVLQASREVKPSQAMQQLAARSVGARRMDAESLRVAALQSWLIPTSEPTTPARDSEAPAPAPRPAEDGLPAFAERVLQTARTSETGRFGDDRVFISHVWRAMRSHGLDEQSFKNRLVEANQKRLLSLSRADMVELMDPADVQASEIHHLGSTFHFIAL
ncbi:hypothetical protein [Archangium lansingense]|uniref:Uncharacterized protein n=1 Tax=Archangium lansingense TaxID=2995310 RepID=A0ABT4APJ9_9BACT|nr:hypothetical protein [Archangium lansinium]MCY1083627.1 hypothetical protein [Archangium lansinium]